MATQKYLSEHRRSHTDELTNYFLNVTLRHRLCSKSFVAIPEKGGRRARADAANPARAARAAGLFDAALSGRLGAGRRVRTVVRMQHSN